MPSPFLQDHRACRDRWTGETAWNALGTFHSTLQFVTCCTSSSVKPGNLLITIQHHPQTVAPGPLFEKRMNPARAPQRNTSVCATTNTAFDKSESKRVVGSSRLGCIDHDETIVVHQKIKQPRQFSRSRLGRVGLLRSREKMHSVFRRVIRPSSKETSSGAGSAGIEHAKLRPQIQMQGACPMGAKSTSTTSP